MKLELFQYICKNCGAKYSSPNLVGSPYGEFLMRASSGDMVYLDSFKDKVFDEVEKIFFEVKKDLKINKENESNIFQKSFSSACDVAPDGSLYRIGQKPSCPNCGKNDVADWGRFSPRQFIEQEIKKATHESWEKLNKDQKKHLLHNVIESYTNFPRPPS